MLWVKRAGVFVLWCVSMVFFRVGSSPAAAPLTVGDAFAYLGRCFMGWGPARFASELYAAASGGFYANAIMVAAYYGFVALVLALAFYLDTRRAFAFKNKPSEICLANEKHRWAVYYALSLPCWQAISCRAAGLGAADLVCTRGSDSCAVGARHASPAAFPSDVIYRQVAGRACPAPTFYKN